jgi:ABC-type cobalamin/Fe3+-siderophores transport system ATPase subunit
MTQKEQFLALAEASIKQIDLHKQVALACEVDDLIVSLHDEVLTHFSALKDLVSGSELSVNYTNQFTNDINQTLNSFPYRQQQNIQFIQPQNKEGIKKNIEGNLLSIEKQLKLMQFNLEFFKKLNFLNSNIVAVGANGSGKTTLSNDLKKYLPNNGVVISAQKVLIIPTFSGISNYENTTKQLQSAQVADKSLKVTYTTENSGNAYHLLAQLGGEFKVLLDNLIAERSSERNKFCDALLNGAKETVVPTTKLDKALKIWNSLIQHRVIECEDGLNITLRSTSDKNYYPAHQMSDGEKVILYLIAHVLQAPLSGFIIVDEPEMYLHKTILKKLWDILEQERQDCIFIYLTHDLDFATSRTTAKKVWIRSFIYPNTWEIENIPDNELPEPLLLELLGSRKNILFCEGKTGSIDEKIYNILFPNFTITPVDGCFDVISYTKAFNKLPNLTTRAFGLIDSDHHGTSRLKALEPENIFSFSMTEPENLFLDEDFLKVLAKQVLVDEAKLKDIKDEIISQLGKELDLQISNYVSSKINYYFKDSHVSKGNDLATVTANYTKFTSEIKINDWYNEREVELKEIIKNRDYVKTLSIFNHKGLNAIACKHLKISDFTDKAIKLLQFQLQTHDILRKHFPAELVKKNGS